MATTCSRAAAPRALARAGSASSRSMAARSAAGSPGGTYAPLAPSTMMSVWPVVREQTTARPIDMASRIVVMPAWKSVSTAARRRGGVGVELAQVLEAEPADLDVGGDVGPRSSRSASTTGWRRRSRRGRRGRGPRRPGSGSRGTPARPRRSSGRAGPRGSTLLGGEELGVDHERVKHDPLGRVAEVARSRSAAARTRRRSSCRRSGRSRERRWTQDLLRRRQPVPDHHVAKRGR